MPDEPSYSDECKEEFVQRFIQELRDFKNAGLRNSLRIFKYKIAKRFLHKGKEMFQYNLIHKFDWDILIILDACRYDYFENEYKKYLSGKLYKVRVTTSCTIDWLRKTWKGFYPLTYFSANPLVNSKHVILNPSKPFFALKHFKKIIDIWDFGWDKRVSTVPPHNVNRTFKRTYSDKAIIHYLQPHGPWIGETKILIQNIHILNQPDLNTIRQLLPDKVLLQKAYRENLRLVLKYVKKLWEESLQDKKVVVTSDHGELLGEYGAMYLHPNLDYPELREVPWLRLGEREGRSQDKEKIMERLRALGYM